MCCWLLVQTVQVKLLQEGELAARTLEIEAAKKTLHVWITAKNSEEARVSENF